VASGLRTGVASERLEDVARSTDVQREEVSLYHVVSDGALRFLAEEALASGADALEERGALARTVA
jgi:hypothetical protein